MKPIICWYCAYLGKCMDYNENGCEKFNKWKQTYNDVATMCNVSVRTLFRWFARNEKKALEKIYQKTGYKFKTMSVDSKRFLVRVVNEE